MIEKLKYIAEKNYHSLDEITKLLIKIVIDLDSELKKTNKKLNKKPVIKEKTVEPKKKRLFRK